MASQVSGEDLLLNQIFQQRDSETEALPEKICDDLYERITNRLADLRQPNNPIPYEENPYYERLDVRLRFAADKSEDSIVQKVAERTVDQLKVDLEVLRSKHDYEAIRFKVTLEEKCEPKTPSKKPDFFDRLFSSNTSELAAVEQKKTAHKVQDVICVAFWFDREALEALRAPKARENDSSEVKEGEGEKQEEVDLENDEEKVDEVEKKEQEPEGWRISLPKFW